MAADLAAPTPGRTCNFLHLGDNIPNSGDGGLLEHFILGAVVSGGV